MQSLGSLATKDGLITFAGINSSQADQNAGKNEHLRSFDIKYPPRKRQRTEKLDEQEDGAIKAIGKRSLFKPSTAAKKETYQRLLRLSPAQKRGSGSKRIGAVATGMAKDSEIIVFNATNATPDGQDVIARIQLENGAEAADMDIAEPTPSEFSLAYCTESDIFEQTYDYNFGTRKVEKTPNGSRRIYQMPTPDDSEKSKSRPKFRSLRFLNDSDIVTLANKPNKGGAEIRIFHLYPTGPAALILEKTLPSRIKQAVSMDVCALDTDVNGNQQIIVAVAGQEISIEVYTTNYQRKTGTFSAFKSYLTLRNVHEHQMTKICLSPFHSPQRALDPEGSTTGANGESVQTQATDLPNHPGPQYVRLASVTYGNTVVVDTFPLSPLEPSDKHSRYVLSHPSDERFFTIAFVVIASLIVLIVAFMVQSFMTDFSDDNAVGPFSWLPKSFRDMLDRPAGEASGFRKRVVYNIHSAADSGLPSNMPGKGRLREFLANHDHSSGKALVISDEGDSTDGGSTTLTVDVHPDKEAYLKQDSKAKHWHEMSEVEKTVWKQRLIRAGEWAEGEGEKVLIGVLFSEYAGLVGAAAREL